MGNTLWLLIFFSNIVASAADGSQKLRYELINKIKEGNHITLVGKKHCDSFIKNGKSTVGQFMAWNLSFFGKDQENSVEASCNKQDGANVCALTFNADSKSESLWSWWTPLSLRF